MKSLGFFSSSIGKKVLVAATAACWAGFVLVHMLGNVLLFVSAEAYNRYSHVLIHNPAIYLFEALMVTTLLVHIIGTIQLTLRNQMARGSRTFLTTSGDKGVPWASKTMIYHGMILGAFVVYHVATLKYGTVYTITYGDVTMRDVHRLVVEVFQVPQFLAIYLAVAVFLGFHLSHGIESMFQSIGFNHPRYTPALKKVGLAYSLLVGFGFFIQAAYVFFYLKG